MKLATLVVLMLVAASALACGDDDGNSPSRPTTNGTQPANGEQGSPTNADGEPPTAFEEARGDFAASLEAIGSNIGAVPEDVRADLLDRCNALAEYADGDDVESICSAVERAMDSGDFGLVDLVLEQLRELEGA